MNPFFWKAAKVQKFNGLRRGYLLKELRKAVRGRWGNEAMGQWDN
jgi:hypothetical protein